MEWTIATFLQNLCLDPWRRRRNQSTAPNHILEIAAPDTSALLNSDSSYKAQSLKLACIDSLSSCVFMIWQLSESCTPKTARTIDQKQSKHQQPLANMYWNNAKCPRHSWPGKPRAISSKLFGFMILQIQMFQQGLLWSCNISPSSSAAMSLPAFKMRQSTSKASCKRKKDEERIFCGEVAHWPAQNCLLSKALHWPSKRTACVVHLGCPSLYSAVLTWIWYTNMPKHLACESAHLCNWRHLANWASICEAMFGWICDLSVTW